MLYPLDGATNVPAGPITIRWSGGNGSYNYTLSGNSEYGSSSSSGSISIIGIKPSIERDLLPGTTYELRISSGYSSGTFSFTTADPANTTDPTGPAIDPLDPVETVKVSSVAIKPPELLLAVGEKETLELFIEPADAPDKSVIFASSNNSVATVDASGVVTAVAPGSAMITATANSARENAGNGACYVKVIKTRVPVSSVMLGYKELNLVVGDTVGLGYGVEPDGATDYSVSFASSNNSVATVDASGAVTAVAPGSATITATANDGGGASDSCSVTVTAPGQVTHEQVTGVTIDGFAEPGSAAFLTVGQTMQFTATVLPDNATNKKVKWSTSNAKNLTVDANGKVTTISPGSGTIKVTTEDGGFTAEVYVDIFPVYMKVDTLPKASPITEGSPLSASALTGGRVIDPTTGAVVKGTFGWKDPAYVPTRDTLFYEPGALYAYESFEVTFRPAGAAEKYALDESQEGRLFVQVEIKFPAVPASSITLTQENLNIVEGNKATLRWTVEPADATDKGVSFASSNNSVAKVDALGVVTAVAPGSATITATANDGNGASDSCSVTVQKAPIKAIGVGLDRSFITLIIGESAQLTANVLPYNATNKKVKWSTSNAKVTTVGGDGKVTATGAGNAVVTVMTEDGGFTAEANVEVSKIVPSIDALPKASAITEGSPLSASAITGGRVIDLSTGAVVKGTFTWNIPTLVPALADSGMNFDLRFRPANAAKYEGVAGAVPVEVKAAVVPVEGVKLDKSAYDIFVGKTAQAAATVIPADATDKKVLWSTSDNKIATIDASGKITGVAEGEAKIKAATADGDFAAEANVRVSKRPTSVTLKPAASAISEGSALKASALTGGTAVSDGAPVQGGFVWSAPEIVPLLADSLKTKYGVKFVPTDKNRYAESQAKVILEIKQTVFPVAGVAISAKTLELRANESAGLSAAVAPANATDKAVQWNTSNASVAKVDADGNVTALAEGTAEISVTTEDGGYTDSCAVTVLPSGEPVSGVNIENQKVRLNPGESAQLVATVLPAEAGNKKLLWKSADEKVATVDENGFVTAVGPGKTVISAVTEDGGFTAESVVYIGGGEGGGGGCDTGAGILLLTFTIPFIYRRKR